MNEAPAHQTRPSSSTAHPSSGPPTARFSARKRGATSARARANDARGPHFHVQRHSHECGARGPRGDRAQERCCTPKTRRTRPCAAQTRGRMSTAGGAGGRRAQGEANGQQMGCCGCRACPGDGVRGSAGLQGVRRGAARAGLCHCQTARSRVLGRWYSSPFDDLASLLPSTALLNHKGKQRGRFWGQWAGHTGFGCRRPSGSFLHIGSPAAAQDRRPNLSQFTQGRVCWHAECIGLGRWRTRAHQFEHAAIEGSAAGGLPCKRL